MAILLEQAIILIQQLFMSGNLLLPFNNFTFSQTTQILLSNMNFDELNTFLAAIQGQSHHQQLAHIVRTRILVTICHQLDRSIYYVHYNLISQQQLIADRCNLIAAKSNNHKIEEILKKYNQFQMQVHTLQLSDHQNINEALISPPLALPPIRRETLAPYCQTTYQIALVCPSEQEDVTCEVAEALLMNVLETLMEMYNVYLEALEDPFEHFMQLTIRFNAFRDTVLALHSLNQVENIHGIMELWKNKLQHHYDRSNRTFVQLMDNQNEQPCEILTPSEIKNEGYMLDYTDSLIDLSVSQQNVVYCGHSQQPLGQPYLTFQQCVISQLEKELKSLPTIDETLINQKHKEWLNLGIKTTTIRKVLERHDIWSQFEEKSKQEDAYIETCARIHGFRSLSGLECCMQ